MILNLKNAKLLKKDRKENTAFGIQTWLYNNGFIKSQTHEDQIDAKQYRELINNFCATIEGFEPTKAKTLESLENYINSRFAAFRAYCKLNLAK